MKVEVNGNEVSTTETGFLVNIEDWTEDVAQVIASQEGIVLEQRHWDVTVSYTHLTLPTN